MIKNFLKRLLWVIGVLFLIYCCVEHLFPYQTQRCINTIYHYINNSPDDDTIYLEVDSETQLYHVNAIVNDVELTFILDTGCSSMLMSQVDFAYLKRRGAISKYDYIGETQTTNADGLKSVCEVYNIRKLKLGDYTLNNIQCIISDEQDAYLLLGQEVLSKFTKVTIDYSNHTLKLEK